jgi:hypothetical protein
MGRWSALRSDRAIDLTDGVHKAQRSSSMSMSKRAGDPVWEDEGSDLHEHPCRIQVDLVHGLRISKPSFERDTQGLSLPVGNRERSSFSAQGSESSLPSWRQSRTVLTFVHRDKSC